MDRRQFLKILGAGAAATTLSGCASKGGKAPAEVPADKMTYRINPKTGEKVSLLGYGCMRWPFITAQDGGSSSEAIDQQTVNELVDYALAHGVNYFDTAPFYCRALSEKATGTALKRHPRDSYYIATKMSNMGVEGRGLSPKETFDASMQIYRNSFESLQTDYIDYYLLHAVGTGSGLEAYRERFEYNGLLDFLLAEREAGRIRNLGFSFHGDIATYDYLLSLHEKVHWDFVQIQFNYVDYTHGGGGKNNAQYLYSELEKRGIPAVVMEPLLGGRLAGLSDHLGERLQQHRPGSGIGPLPPSQHIAHGVRDHRIGQRTQQFCNQCGNLCLTGGAGRPAKTHQIPFDLFHAYAPHGSFSTNALKCRPRSSKFLYISKLALAGDMNTMSPSPASRSAVCTACSISFTR